MTRVLIIEDEPYKLDDLLKFANEQFGSKNVRDARSVNAGLKALDEQLPDLLLLDMTLTMFDSSVNNSGGRPQHLGGRVVLDDLAREKKRVPTIVVSQYMQFNDGKRVITATELCAELARDYPDLFVGFVKYEDYQDGWGDLKITVDRFLNGEINESSHSR